MFKPRNWFLSEGARYPFSWENGGVGVPCVNTTRAPFIANRWAGLYKRLFSSVFFVFKKYPGPVLFFASGMHF